MKIKQKAKYIALGAIGMTVAIPVIIKATDAVPITFSQGDILSAEVLNTLFGRLNDVQTGFEASQDLVGGWTCVSYSTRTTCDAGWNAVGDGVRYSRSQTIQFACSNGSCTATASTFDPTSCNAAGGAPLSTGYAVAGTTFASPDWGGVTQLQKLSPAKFNWISGSSSPKQEYTVCTKQSQPPTPPTALTGTATGTSVALTWDDQSTDETGFKVQTKTEVGGTWTTLQTTAAGLETYTHTSAATGNNWYRVLATNANGDSITSNEILVEVR